MTVEELRVVITAETSELRRAIGDVNSRLGGLRSSTAQVSNSMGQMGNTTRNILGSVGKTLAVAFSVKVISQFVASCTKMGSDLAEVQNVVDVTFGELSYIVDDFASSAIKSFGLSETSAKKYASTMGAMLKSMRLTKGAALDMSIELTKLSADMASFYNLSSEEAFNKIRAGISGETEPLKQLGINMSVANLEAYALSQGMSKAYNSMSQQEQVLLRYNYLLSVTADAQGDFSRNSDSWANQTRILSEQFNSLKTNLGQGFIAALTPVVKVLNVLVERLVVAAGYFKAFMELVFGKQSVSEGTGLSGIANTTGDIVGGAGDASDAVEGIGDAAKSAGKKAKGALASFDELNQISFPDSGGSGGGSDMSGGLGKSMDIDLGSTTEQTSEMEKGLNKIIDKFNELKGLAERGFKIGFGSANLSGLQQAIESVKKGFMGLFTDGTILQSFNGMISALATSVGQYAGSMASIGVNLATALVGGIGQYLNENATFIKERMVGIFDAKAEIFELMGNYSVALAEILSPIGGVFGQEIVANIIGVFSNGFLGILELSTKLGRDIIMSIIQPIIDNKESLRQAIEGTLEVIAVVTGTIKDLVTNTMQQAVEVYDQYLAPAFENIADGISQIVKALTDAYNTYIQPTLLEMGKSWESFYSESLQPVIDKALEVFGKLTEGVSQIWNQALAPFVAWAIGIMAPYLANTFQNISEAFKLAVDIIVGIVDSLLTVLGGLIDFIMGVFTGDWSRAWTGIKTVFKGIIDTLYALALEPLSKILSYVTGVFVRGWKTGWEGAGKVFSTVFDGLKNAAKGPLNWVIDMINKVLRGVNDMTSNLNKLPGVDIGRIRELPRLARGGIVDKPTNFGNYIAGEAGAEMIVPLENTPFVDKLASSLGNAVMQAMTLVEGTSPSPGAAQNLSMEMDGNIFARTLAPYMLKEFRRLGFEL